MFIHVLVPNGLSWTRNGVPKTEEAHERLKRAKSSARPEDLCFGLPEEFEEFLRYCRRLRFDEEPNYKLWIERFRDLKKNIGCGDSMNFIWPPPEVSLPSVEVFMFDNVTVHRKRLSHRERLCLLLLHLLKWSFFSENSPCWI